MEISGPIIFLGGLLLLITSVLEFILGNTFPCVVFGIFGELGCCALPSIPKIDRVPYAV